MFQRLFEVCFHPGEILFLIFFAANHDMIHARYAILWEQFGKQCAKPALHPVAGHGISDFLGHRDTKADGVGSNRVFGVPFMSEQNETRRHESLSAIRCEKIGTFANHLDVANGVLIVDKLRLRIGHRITLFSAGADALGRELLAATVTAGSQYFAASDGRFAGAETMAAFADQAAWLKCALHRVYPT